VEADPAVLNLSTFETFYPEAAFFIEGRIRHRSATRPGGMFYSRRIGRALSPRRERPGGQENHRHAQATTILGPRKSAARRTAGHPSDTAGPDR
jgi:hypothetical protein